MRSCLVLNNRITYVTLAHIWNKHAQGREALDSDAMRGIFENLACACFGWPPQVSDAMQKFLDHLEDRYVQTPLCASDRTLFNCTQPHVIQFLQQYDPHLRKAFLRALKCKKRATASLPPPPPPPSNTTFALRHQLEGCSCVEFAIDSAREPGIS